MNTVKSLHIYPIKGMQGTSVQSVKALERGFEHDRRYMLIDEKGVFISQRSHPTLVFFQPQIINNDLSISYQNKTFTISLHTSLQNNLSTTLFDQQVAATEVSQEANVWFSTILNENVRLVKMLRKDVRKKELNKGPAQVEVSFADGYPYLILGTASLERLNSVLEISLDFDRFRPNIVLETSIPHIEDSWNEISIGEGEFLIIKPCARCPVTTVDQTNGTKSKEPLKTLSTYRKRGNNVFFGANAISRKDSCIHVGDEVVVL